MTGGGKQNAPAAGRCRKYILTKVCRFIKNQKGLATNYFRKSAEKLSLHSDTSGSILIEFAVCMPILIILLFYINDLVKIKRYYAQTEFVGQQMANMLQNISKGQRVTLTNMKHAAALAWLSVYPGKTMYSTDGTSDHHPLIHFPWVNMYFVKGEAGGKAKCLWGKTTRCSYGTNPSRWYVGDITSSVTSSTVAYNSNVVPAETIHPILKINEGDKKIILETSIYWNQSYKDGNEKSVSTAHEAFGCYQVNPKHLPKHNWLFFNSVVIFTPKPGLFDETPPS